MAVSIAVGAHRRTKAQGHRPAVGVVTLGIAAIAICHGWRADHFCEYLRLSVAQRKIVRKSHPQSCSRLVRPIAGHQQAAAGDIDSLANFGLLSKGGTPAKSHWQAELRAMVLPSVHKPNSTS